MMLKIKEETTSADFVTYKRTVYHKGWEIILHPIKESNKEGVWIVCGDEEGRKVVVWVVILSADYEEQ